MNIQSNGFVNFKAKVSSLESADGGRAVTDHRSARFEQGQVCIYARNKNADWPEYTFGAGTISFIKKLQDGNLQLILKPGIDSSGDEHDINHEVMLEPNDHLLTTDEYLKFKENNSRRLSRLDNIVEKEKANAQTKAKKSTNN